MYDYSKLRGRIVEKFGTLRDFAHAFGISERSISLKMNNKREWKQPQIAKAADMLDIDPQDIYPYFFTVKVQND